MTVFSRLKVGGPDTGIPSTNDQSEVGFIRTVDVSASDQSATLTLPDNAFIYDVRPVVSDAVSAATTIRVGDSGDNDKYATSVSVSAAGVYSVTLTGDIVSAKEVTVQTSGAFTAGKVQVQIVGGTRDSGGI